MAQRVTIRERSKRVYDAVSAMYPQAHCELIHRSDFELLCAIALSAQTTDEAVNRATPRLFAQFPTPDAMADALEEDIADCIRTIGLFRNKAKHLKAMSRMIVMEFGGIIPADQAKLELLPGVGRKTANVFLAVWHHVPRIAVDTHVERVAKRLGLCKEEDTVLQVEESLKRRYPSSEWIDLHHRLLFFGRYHCTAKTPKCAVCPLRDICKKPLS